MNEKPAMVPLGPDERMDPPRNSGHDSGKADQSRVSDARSHARKGSRFSALRILAIGITLYALVVLALGVVWSRQPAKFDVATLQSQEIETYGGKAVPGTAVVAAAIGVGETLLEKPGGFLYNDLTPPGLYLDNMPKWEYGALKELRDSVRALRNDFSRSQTQSIESEHAKQADVKLAIDASSWLLPSAEEEYRQAVDSLRLFMRDLATGQDRSVRFYARADNLAAYLSIVEKRLGSLALRLSASVGDHELTAALVQNVDGSNVEPEATQVGSGDSATPWHLVDNTFYEARGYTWALLHMMRAISIDFADILASKNADMSMQQIIRDLEGASKPMVSPIVLNGHGYGFVANHSLVMASYISRANAAVLDLRILMQQG
ncbi:DUF2333 family protein [Thiocapsa marina]|uniref:Uncharacterized conserved protein UCP029693 n=1 Tax=Thiocapsa marina 5811 TaxID=768671 RepID=F9UED6_9GAMM|nr:DUF2333 family protein [Thiocapsa marina]EGV17257.1 Uncharacterized conserved protein UCP029693 [Thiocapsa marina 5811]